MTDMKTAYRLAAAAVRRRYAEQRPHTLARLNALTKSDVAVYRGVHDHVQEVLNILGVPHSMDPKKLEHRIAFVNCTSKIAHVDKLERFAREGGLVVSSDWALRTIQKTFPGMIRKGGSRATGDEVVGVEATADSLWSEVVVLGTDPQWWLEGGSDPIVIDAPDKVVIEAASHEMLQRYAAPVVAASFPWGAGHVFHVVSHFWLKRTRTAAGRHAGPAADFMRAGLKLSEEGIDAVFAKTKIDPKAVSFASLQSAATATELVARLCADGLGAQPGLPFVPASSEAGTNPFLAALKRAFS